MNLNAYDTVTDKIDKNKTWIDVRKKTIFSRDIKYRRYICLLKKYDVKTDSNTYFIAMLDNPPVNRKYKLTSCDSYGRIKIDVSSVWKDTYLNRVKSNCNIDCELLESEEDGDVYSIDI